MKKTYGLALILILVSRFADAAIQSRDKELIFKDKDGRPIKTLNAGNNRSGEYVETRKAQKMIVAGKERTVDQRVIRKATVAKSQKGALISETILSFATARSSAEAAAFAGSDAANLGATSSVELYDASGNLRWKKSLEEHKEVFEKKLSADAGTVVVTEGCSFGCSEFRRKGEPRQRLRVWDSDGKELVSFPSKATDCEVGTLGQWISADGAFVITSCQMKKKLPTSVVLDVHKHRIWRAPYLIDVIREKGKGKLEIQATGQDDKSEMKELDLDQIQWEPLQ